jgi:aminoglycoside 3-N-acetyltransferase I
VTRPGGPDARAFRIHRIGPGDPGVLHALLDVFGEAFNEANTYGDARPGRRYLERLLGGDTFVALAALKEGEVVGGLAAYVLHKFERERSEIYIYDLAVAEPHRRQGIATALIRELQGIAPAYGADVLMIQADAADAPAVAVYERLGTREEVLHFDIPVPPP